MDPAGNSPAGYGSPVPARPPRPWTVPAALVLTILGTLGVSAFSLSNVKDASNLLVLIPVLVVFCGVPILVAVLAYRGVKAASRILLVCTVVTLIGTIPLLPAPLALCAVPTAAATAIVIALPVTWQWYRALDRMSPRSAGVTGR